MYFSICLASTRYWLPTWFLRYQDLHLLCLPLFYRKTPQNLDLPHIWDRYYSLKIQEHSRLHVTLSCICSQRDFSLIPPDLQNNTCRFYFCSSLVEWLSVEWGDSLNNTQLVTVVTRHPATFLCRLSHQNWRSKTTGSFFCFVHYIFFI